MPQDSFSFPYYVEILLDSADHREALTSAISRWPHKVDTSGSWAIVNFDRWDPAMAAGDEIDAALDGQNIPHNIVLNSRFHDFRRWT